MFTIKSVFAVLAIDSFLFYCNTEDTIFVYLVTPLKTYNAWWNIFGRLGLEHVL